MLHLLPAPADVTSAPVQSFSSDGCDTGMSGF